jgi:hypothetical protein
MADYIGHLRVEHLEDNTVKFQIVGMDMDTTEVIGDKMYCVIEKAEADVIAMKILGWRL